MEFGTKISQKIRSAIKAKLVDLGAYVDDELPDYIMVMVANKKNHAAMTEDLNLFLGSNTDNFCAWLRELLGRLQSIPTDINSEAEQAKVIDAKNNQPGTVASTTTDGAAGVTDEINAVAMDTAPVGAPRPATTTVDVSSLSSEPTQAALLPSKQVAPKTSDPIRKTSETHSDTGQKHGGSRTHAPSIVEPHLDEDPVLKLGPDVDEFDEEMAQEGATKPVPAAKPASRGGKENGVTSTVHSVVTKASSSRDTRRRSGASPIRVIITRDGSERTTSGGSSKSRGSTRGSQSSGSHRDRADGSHGGSSDAAVAGRKRRIPSSAIGAVVSREMETEEEYDPMRPAIGSVASVVRVTERKSSVPVPMQASKSLVLKAVSEAQVSVESAARRSAIHAGENASMGVRPTSRGQGAHPSDPDHHHQRQQRSDPPALQRPTARGSDRHSNRSSLRSRLGKVHGLYQDAGGADRGGRGGEADRGARGGEADRGARGGEAGRPELTSRSRREDAPGRLRGADARRPEDQDPPRPDPGHDLDRRRVPQGGAPRPRGDHSDLVDDGFDERLSPPRPLAAEARTLGLVEDSRHVHLADGGVSRAIPPQQTTETMMDTLVQSGAEQSDFTDEEVEESFGNGNERIGDVTVVEERPANLAAVGPRPRPPSPKFVVTLDGVDPTKLQGDQNEAESRDVTLDLNLDDGSEFIEDGEDASKEDEEESNGMVTPTIVKVKPQRQSTPNWQQVTVNLNDSEDEFDDDIDLFGKRSRMTERCRFWPGCRNGDSCPFLHPTEPCRKFPKCTFGDKCHFVHPECRFDVNCTKTNCPFTHTFKRPGPTSPSALPLLVQPIRVPLMPVAGAQFADDDTVVSGGVGRGLHPSQVPCRYGTECHTMNCIFLHAKPCRYGISCNNKSDCIYSHPKLPTRDQLKWPPTTIQPKSPLSPPIFSASAVWS